MPQTLPQNEINATKAIEKSFKEFHRIYGKKNNNLQQVIEFLNHV
jgi:hypothetical protein